ncbi:MAG: two-component regulator propeller domain-containing protein [Alistipes onderdonkii]
MKRIIYLVCIHLLCSTAAQASNLRQISSREGISNNAILSLAQDKHGFIWVGSCDGLNMWDGERMRLFPNDWGEYTPLSGNLIEEIAVTTDSLFWIRTNYGLDLFDPDSKHVEPHTCFQGMYRVVTRSSDEVIVITQDNKFSYYDRTRHEFAPTRPMQQGRYADILEMVLDDEGNLWSFSRKGIFCMPVKIPADGQGDIRFGETQQIALPSLPEFAFREGNRVYFIDRNKVFYEFDIKSRQIIYIKDMREELAAMGQVSRIISDGDDYLVSFNTNGVVRLKTTPQNSVKYVTEHINITCGADDAARCPAGDRMDRHRRAGALPVHAQCGGFPLDHLQRPALQPFEARACALRRPRTQPVGGHQGRRIIAHPQLLRQKDLRRSPCRTENHGQQRSAGQLGLHFRRKQPQPAVDRHRRRRAELLLLCRPKDPPPRRPRGDAVHPHAARDGAGHPVGGFGRLRYIPHHARRIADPS